MQQRDSFTQRLLWTRADIAALQDENSALLALTAALMGIGHEVGSRLIWYSDSGTQALERVSTKIAQALAAARDIDITVEVPDPPLSDG